MLGVQAEIASNAWPGFLPDLGQWLFGKWPTSPWVQDSPPACCQSTVTYRLVDVSQWGMLAGPSKLKSASRGRSVALQALASAAERAAPGATCVSWLTFANRGRSIALLLWHQRESIAVPEASGVLCSRARIGAGR